MRLRRPPLIATALALLAALIVGGCFDRPASDERPAGRELSADPGTLRAGQDTATLRARASDGDTTLAGEPLQWRSTDTTLVRVEGDRAWAPIEPTHVRENRGPVPLSERPPLSPGPRPVDLVARSTGGAVAGTVRVVRTTPPVYLNLHPDGRCQLSRAAFEAHGLDGTARGHATAWVEARDGAGRPVPLDSVAWTSRDSLLVPILHYRDARQDRHWLHYRAEHAGRTWLVARAAGMADSMLLLSADSIADGRVVCPDAPSPSELR